MQNRNSNILLCVLTILICGCSVPKFPFDTNGVAVIQKKIPRVQEMPDRPAPYVYRDWAETTRDFDNYVFDFNQKGKHMPLIWWDTMGRNFPDKTFGLYTAIGDVRMGPNINNGENHEALGALGAVLSASLIGIDKSNQNGHNYVQMLRNYFNKDNGWNVIMNFTNKGAHIGGGYGNDFWYEVHNNVLFWCVADLYPEVKDFRDIQRSIAEQFYKSDAVMGKNYSYSFFDFEKMKGVNNHIPTQEDVAGGYAFILYSAWIKFGDQKYLDAAQNAINVLYNQKENRFYEAMMPIAALVAARMNVETGTNYDIQKFLDWTFNGDAVGREGWGVIVDKWGEYDVSGLAGSTVHNGGYGFLMNTFDLMMPLAALVRYDQRFAAAIGKWALHASNAARFCYASGLPDSLQALAHLKGITKDVIAYEGIIKESIYPEFKGKTPFAQGDGPLWAQGNPPESMFSVYGSGHVGFFGSTIRATNVSEILQINCTVTDFYKKGNAYETYLLYNPYDHPEHITIDLPNGMYDVYDTVNRKFLAVHIADKLSMDLDAKAARVVVLVPSGKKWYVDRGKLFAGKICVDYRYTGF